jgi:hypothetical protein
VSTRASRLHGSSINLVAEVLAPVGIEAFANFTDLTKIQLLVIDESTELRDFAKEMKWNQATTASLTGLVRSRADRQFPMLGMPERAPDVPSCFPFSGSRKAHRVRAVFPGGGVRSVRVLCYSLCVASPLASSDAASPLRLSSMASRFTTSFAPSSSMAASLSKPLTAG